jgi:cation diffusion facilitator CzcD-associated flavoprotein CzcO
MANWLETYADLLELTVWTSSEATRASYNDKTERWTVSVARPGKPDRTFQVKHVVFCTGWVNGAKGYIPEIKGGARFKGEVMHSLEHKRASDHQGKKVVVVGACTSGQLLASIYPSKG